MKKQLMKRFAATATVAAMVAPVVALAQTTSIDLEFGSISDELGLGTQANVKVVIAQIVRVLLGFLGIIAVLIVLWGGFQWMTAAGNEERVGQARATLTAGLIGLIIILSAYAIARFIIDQILESTGAPTAT